MAHAVSGNSAAVPASPKQLCCPNAVTFDRPLPPRIVPYAFDDTTTAVDTGNGQFPYWQVPGTAPTQTQPPPPGSLTPPTNRQNRDGAKWVSIATGETMHLKSELLGQGCIPNVTFESQNAAVADVVTKAPSGVIGTFELEGKSAGETSLLAKCNGNFLGWVHVWVADKVTIDVDVASIVTANSRAANYVIADLQSYINDIYKQLLIEVSLTDVGAVTVAPPNQAYNQSQANLLVLDVLAQAANTGFSASYRLLYYVNTAAFSGGYGVVPGGLGAPGPGYAFFDHDINGSYNTMAHEFGHLLNLSHPAHDTDQDEYPLWQFSNFARRNVLGDDPWNLMGYNGSLAQRGPNRRQLRYLQWLKCNRS